MIPFWDKKLSVREVFTPFSYPGYTYVSRPTAESELAEAVAARGAIACIAGPPKIGKTVLIDRVLGSRACWVEGSQIDSIDDVWRLARSSLARPATISHTTSAEVGFQLGASGKHLQTDTTTISPDPMQDVVVTLQKANRVLVIDDFHYLNYGTQVALARRLKSLSRQAVPVAIVTIPHRGGEVLVRNPDLRGVSIRVDIPTWSEEDLLDIALTGFAALGIVIDHSVLLQFAQSSLGSPQLMQGICLSACDELGHSEQLTSPEKFVIGAREVSALLLRTSRLADCSVILEELLAVCRDAPPHGLFLVPGRGRMVAAELILRSAAISVEGTRASVESIVTQLGVMSVSPLISRKQVLGVVTRLDRAIQRSLAKDRVVEWNQKTENLHFNDPHFLFYLRIDTLVHRSGRPTS